MKPSSIAALVVGVLVSAIVIALSATHVLRPVEEAFAKMFAGEPIVTSGKGMFFQYALVVVVALTVAWLILNSSRRKRLGWPLAVFALELVAIAWVCQLYQTFFQPLPSLLAVGLSFAAANGYAAFSGVNKSSVARRFFRDRLSDAQLSRLSSGEITFDPEAKIYEATAVVCDIANKHDLADEVTPAELAEITEKFIRHATESFLKAGAYIETVTGEGIVAIFGFPGPDTDQAEKSTRHALTLLESFDELRENSRDEAFKKLHVHVGISSGMMMISPMQGNANALLATGEPVELARRFCIANRFYGSRVLIGPQTFELSSKAIVARPIDFLSGVDVRERHEIYEPLKLVGEATPEEIARRDFFWHGVVLYREKRWAEAYSQFQKARGPNEYEDAPLQLYLRRIEPLALHLTEPQ
ncbi:MAG: adenylate/guanylate cyclase domain-containing protein [Chthoniobacterales bacterium]